MSCDVLTEPLVLLYVFSLFTIGIRSNKLYFPIQYCTEYCL